MKLLGSSKVQKCLNKFRRHTYAVLAGLALAHIVCFAVVVTSLNQLHQ
jgi:hypothetical protein